MRWWGKGSIKEISAGIKEVTVGETLALHYRAHDLRVGGEIEKAGRFSLHGIHRVGFAQMPRATGPRVKGLHALSFGEDDLLPVAYGRLYLPALPLLHEGSGDVNEIGELLLGKPQPLAQLLDASRVIVGQ